MFRQIESKIIRSFWILMIVVGIMLISGLFHDSESLGIDLDSLLTSLVRSSSLIGLQILVCVVWDHFVEFSWPFCNCLFVTWRLSVRQIAGDARVDALVVADKLTDEQGLRIDLVIYDVQRRGGRLDILACRLSVKRIIVLCLASWGRRLAIHCISLLYLVCLILIICVFHSKDGVIH